VNFFKDGASPVPTTDVSDALIASELLEMTKTSALLTTTHYLECVTPGLREVLRLGLNNCLNAHEEVMEIAIKNEWYPAYLPPVQQLQDDLKFLTLVRPHATV